MPRQMGRAACTLPIALTALVTLRVAGFSQLGRRLRWRAMTRIGLPYGTMTLFRGVASRTRSLLLGGPLATVCLTLLAPLGAKAQTCGPGLPACPAPAQCIIPVQCPEPPCSGSCQPVPCAPAGLCQDGMVCDAVTVTCQFGSSDGPAPNITDLGIEYFHYDALGSIRMVTDENGNVSSRHDYHPFGEEISAGVNGRDQIAGYGDDNGTRHRFTGKERDAESGLDYFGARYFSAAQGRFTAVDPALDWKRYLGDPQQWNRYAYVGGNPLKAIDPDGEQSVWANAGPFSLEADFAAGRITPQEYTIRTNMNAAGNALLAAGLTGLALAASGPGLAASAVSFAASPAGHNTINAVGDALSPVPTGLSPIQAAVTLEKSLASGLVKAGGKLEAVLQGIEGGFAQGQPGNLVRSLKVVAEAADAAGLEAGVATLTTTERVVLKNVGGITTEILENGQITVSRGNDVLLRLLPEQATKR